MFLQNNSKRGVLFFLSSTPPNIQSLVGKAKSILAFYDRIDPQVYVCIFNIFRIFEKVENGGTHFAKKEKLGETV